MVSSFSTVYLSNAQITRTISCSIGFIGCLVILCYELKHRRSLSANDKMKHKWLSLWAMLTIISSILSQVFGITESLPSTVINICPYTTHSVPFTWCSKLIFLGLFQIRRLQKLNTTNDLASNIKLSLLVKLLYIGALVASVLVISFVSVLTVTDYHEFGCKWGYGKVGSIINILWVVVYLCWDGSTLLIYILKLSEYRRTIKEVINSEQTLDSANKQTKKLYNKIKKALSKII